MNLATLAMRVAQAIVLVVMLVFVAPIGGMLVLVIFLFQAIGHLRRRLSSGQPIP